MTYRDEQGGQHKLKLSSADWRDLVVEAHTADLRFVELLRGQQTGWVLECTNADLSHRTALARRESLRCERLPTVILIGKRRGV